jgi:broad specificity phosphatase PhoE
VTATRLILIRHAEPSEDARACCYGRTDFELCEDGHARARRIAAALATEPIAALYTSPLRRARATAAPLGETLALDPIVVDDLRELDFGELDGVKLDEIALRYPQFLGWTEAPASVRFPAGESVADLRDRVLAAAAELRARHRGETIAVVSHALPIRVVLADALGLPRDALFRIGQDYGAISVVDWFGKMPLVRLVNSADLASAR